MAEVDCSMGDPSDASTVTPETMIRTMWLAAGLLAGGGGVADRT
jgi:hypothetical protein